MTIPNKTSAPEGHTQANVGHATVQDWCRSFLTTTLLANKLRPGPAPSGDGEEDWENQSHPERLASPGRPKELRVIDRSPKTPGAGAMVHPSQRAALLHTVAHHELQAAELFAWAILAFPNTPIEFRRGLLRLAQEELKHLGLYIMHMERLGFSFGQLPVRDWFWERAKQCETPLDFVSFVGIGLEGANLEHSARFAGWFHNAGDEAGARILERVEQDEIGHVAFADHWYREFSGKHLIFEDWSEQLPKPLSPGVFRSLPINREARRAAGLSDDFIDRLAQTAPANRPRGTTP